VNKLVAGFRNLLLALGVLFAVFASLVSDSLGLSLFFGATAAGFLTLAGLVALAANMPPLPPFVLPPRSTWQERLHRARRGDRMARLETIEAFDRIMGDSPIQERGLLRDRRMELSSLGRKDFDAFLRQQLSLGEERT
jgi:hypothetical protein